MPGVAYTPNKEELNMGKCVFKVELVGTHHAGGDKDIDQLARSFVKEAQALGHHVQVATLNHGNGEDNLLKDE